MSHTAETPFFITVDTEGDNLWAQPRDITTRNAAFLPRFQSLCERFGLKPVYLTNYEMAMSDLFVEFGRDVVARGAGEIGMHLHAWNSPPLVALTDDDFFHQPYLIVYPARIMREKIRTLTRLLEEHFGQKIASHRAGRWAFDARYAAMLQDEGYCVDCSVTPGVDWRRNPGDPGGKGGSNYTGFPASPYFLDPVDISRPAEHGLLEVPMTIRRGRVFRQFQWVYDIPLLRRIANGISPETDWLCPQQPSLRAPLSRNLGLMLQAAKTAPAENRSHLELMLHSSELMPGGSPGFRNASDIDRLYDALEALFENMHDHCRGMTLQEYHAIRVQQAAGAAPRDGYVATAIPASA